MKAQERLIAEKADEVLRFLNLGAVRDLLAGRLSGGQKKLLELGRALMLEPRLLLLDEPSAALSPVLAAAIFGKIQAIRDAGTTILLVEQKVRKALEISDRGYVLDSGQNAITGAGKALLANPEMGRLYLGGSAARY